MGRTAKTQRLTALTVKKFADSPSTTAPLHDGGGLYLRKRGVAMCWTLRLSDPATGAQQWHRLFPDDPQGAYPHKSLADARTKARRLWAARSDGIDPRAQRRRRIEAQRQAEIEVRLVAQRRLSVAALFDRWASIELQPRVASDGSRLGRKDGGAFTRAQFTRRVFPRLGDVAAADVTRADLLSLLDGVKAEGKLRTANVLLTDLKQMFRFGLTRDIVLRNSLDTVSRRDVGGKPVERDRALSVDELRSITILGSLGVDSLKANGFEITADRQAFAALNIDDGTSLATLIFNINLGTGAATQLGVYNGTLSGLTISAVPEPSTYAMFALGLLAVGASLRRRRQD